MALSILGKTPHLLVFISFLNFPTFIIKSLEIYIGHFFMNIKLHIHILLNGDRDRSDIYNSIMYYVSIWSFVLFLVPIASWTGLVSITLNLLKCHLSPRKKRLIYINAYNHLDRRVKMNIFMISIMSKFVCVAYMETQFTRKKKKKSWLKLMTSVVWVLSPCAWTYCHTS